ncbi:hypothetical protein ACPZ19_50945 [Amycolatopsis lurida]
MRRLITTTISALAVGVALLAGTGLAQAETAQVTGQSSGVGILNSAPPVQAAGWEYYNWYFSFNNCSVAGGKIYQSDPSVKQYKCEPGNGVWYLYLYR